MHPTQQTQTCNFAAWALDQRHAHAGPPTSELRLQITDIKSQVSHLHEQTSDFTILILKLRQQTLSLKQSNLRGV